MLDSLHTHPHNKLLICFLVAFDTFSNDLFQQYVALHVPGVTVVQNFEKKRTSKAFGLAETW